MGTNSTTSTNCCTINSNLRKHLIEKNYLLQLTITSQWNVYDDNRRKGKKYKKEEFKLPCRFSKSLSSSQTNKQTDSQQKSKAK